MTATGSSQIASQTNRTAQTATTTANAVQLVPVNAAAHIAVLSSGNQSNPQSINNAAQSTAINSKRTRHASDQAQQIIS